jgi:hypothetical protein
MASETSKIGRLALRVEGEWWNAYYAMPDTMDDAIHLAAIRMSAVSANGKLKQMFMDTMRELVADILEEKTGQRPTWGGPEAAPEHERSGAA